MGVLDKSLWAPASAWIAYDMANTVYAATVTFVFVPYVGQFIQDRSIVGVVNSVSMVLAGLLVPLLASIADRSGRAQLYLILTSLACIVPAALFGMTGNGFVLMALFGIANLGYNAALVFYNALLPSVASDRDQGLISGLGVGIGYLGTLTTVILLLTIHRLVSPQTMFVLLAAIFLVMALPCFALVRERRVLRREPVTWEMAKAQTRQLFRTLRDLRHDRRLLFFLLANFFCVDVLNTAVLFYSDFTENSFFVNAGTLEAPVWQARGDVAMFGLAFDNPKSLAQTSGLLLNALALVFGCLSGWIVRGLGSLTTMRLAAIMLAGGLIGTAAFAGVSATWFAVSICGFGAFGLAGIWTAGRTLLIEITPRERLGEYSGIHGIALKVSVVGSALFGVIYDVVRRSTGDDLWGWKAALLFQAVPLTLGIILLFLMPPSPKASAT